jgi:hypothetical protein
VTASAREAYLEPKVVGDIRGTFYVPAYQRGYRWGEVEVRRLLGDIWDSRGKPYYLQPIVVKRHGDEWELVDGQQRLTTLFLIFQYMTREGLQNSGADYCLRYETRKGSAAYLEELNPGLGRENIDFFHIYEAYRCISEWFGAHGARRQWAANKFYDALFEDVRVIWYEASDDVDAATLFTRLNVGRIPLTDAELVKALLLSRSRSAAGVTDRAPEIAAQWDGIERDLRKPELWSFITGKDAEEATHISLLLDTLAGGPAGRDRPLFHTFETLREQITADSQMFWGRVVGLHSLVLGWYENRDLYHKIGFLIAEHVSSFSELIERSEGVLKSEFEAELDALIRESLGLSQAELSDLSYPSSRARRALLLMNVETVRQRRYSSERYSFREHAGGRWSLEHIHAQNAEQLNRAEQWREWLRLHRRALTALDEVEEAEKKALQDKIAEVLTSPSLTEAEFRPLERELTELLSADDDSGSSELDSIANLALLDSGDNSALSNSVFAVKRAAILNRDRGGSYIPVCTRNVFLKYYSPGDEQQMHFWSAGDRKYYLDEIAAVLGSYLLAGEDGMS